MVILMLGDVLGRTDFLEGKPTWTKFCHIWLNFVFPAFSAIIKPKAK